MAVIKNTTVFQKQLIADLWPIRNSSLSENARCGLAQTHYQMLSNCYEYGLAAAINKRLAHMASPVRHKSDEISAATLRLLEKSRSDSKKQSLAKKEEMFQALIGESLISIVGKTEHEDFHRIRDARNLFAHGRGFEFDTDYVSLQCLVNRLKNLAILGDSTDLDSIWNAVCSDDALLHFHNSTVDSIDKIIEFCADRWELTQGWAAVAKLEPLPVAANCAT